MVSYKILLGKLDSWLNSSKSNFAKNDFMFTLPLILASFFNTLFCSKVSIDKRLLDLMFKAVVKHWLGMVMSMWFYNLTKVQGFYKINVIYSILMLCYKIRRNEMVILFECCNVGIAI